MALWEKTQKLSGAQLKDLQSVYGEHFPLELRDYLAPWIELQPWSEVDPNNRNHQLHASTLFTDMLECLKKLHGNLRQPFIVRLKAEQHAATMKARYQNQPLEFVRVIQNCLLKEQQLVEHHDTMSMQDTPNSNPVYVIDRGLQQITQMTEKLEADYRVVHNRQEQFVLRYQEVIKLDATLTQAVDQLSADHLQELKQRKQKLDDHLQQEVKEISKLRQELGNNCYKCLQEINKIQSIVLDQELAKWKRAQRLCVQEEMPNKKELDQLQQWCEQLAELLWRNRIQIKQFDKLRKEVPINDPHDPGICHQLQAHVSMLLKKLVQESFIIEKQPPQVLKIKKSFSAEIRLLVGTKLNIYMNTPEVEATIVNDKQAKQVLQKSTIVRDNIGEILNNKRNMEYQASDQTVVCKFPSMQIKNRVRRSAGSDQNVTEEKVAMVFQSVVHIGREVELIVKVISLPVVVVVHGVQHSSAEATVFWDNYFAEPERELFTVPDHVPWNQFSQALSNYFEQQTGRGLNDQNLQYLARRLQNAATVTPNMEAELQDYVVTYSMIVRDHLQTSNPTRKGERGTTFWEWFYATCDLVRSCIKEEWKANLVHGFLDRQDAHEMLQKCLPGTFLIRFSQSQAGLSVAFKKLEEDQSTSIRDLMPWVKSRLISERRMSNRLQDLGELKFLYPSRDKNDAFQDFYTTDGDDDDKSRVTTDGYIITEMKTSINGTPSSGISDVASSQPSPMHPYNTNAVANRWVYSPAGSSLPGMSPFPVTSPGMGVISPVNNVSMTDLEDLISDLETDISILPITPDVTELPDQMLSLAQQLEQGKINYHPDRLKEILDAINKLKPTLEQKLSSFT